MSDINFLSDKPGGGQNDELKEKGDKKENFAWSNPEKEASEPKNSAFSFLAFKNKKPPANLSPARTADKNKIKESREEILNLIKRQEKLKPAAKKSEKNFLRSLGEKLKKQPSAKEVLIDYRRMFEQEKERKNQTADIFEVKATEIKPASATAEKPINEKFTPKQAKAGAPDKNWLKRFWEFFNREPIAKTAVKTAADNLAKSPKAEAIKPAPPVMPLEHKPPEINPATPPLSPAAEQFSGAKGAKILAKEPKAKNVNGQRVLETNLIQGEFVAFFDLKPKIIILLGAVIMPVFVAVAAYYGLILYQKTSQAKNLAQAKKFAELKQAIAEEETGIKEIYAFAAQLKTVSEVFEQHLYWTNFFKFLEDNTIKDVYFLDFDGDTSGSYTMKALAANYSAISSQVKVFKNNKKITKVEANGGEMDPEGEAGKALVKFTLNFSIDKKIFIE